jgi:hypothetical protein
MGVGTSGLSCCRGAGVAGDAAEDFETDEDDIFIFVICFDTDCVLLGIFLNPC